MKATRLIVVISDIWSTEQLETAKACLIKGLEQVVNSGKCGGDLLDGIGHHCDSICSGSGSENPVIKLTNCEIELVMNADKSDVVNVINKAIQGGNAADAVIVLYVGEVTLPFGHWILRDGLFGSTDMHALLMIEAPQQQVIEAGHPTVLLVTPLPCDDWHIIEKKQLPYFSLYGYQLDKETIATGDGFAASLTGFVNAVADKMLVSHIDTEQEGSQLKASITTRSPSLYLFLDKGSASCPALLTLDGFAMLFNCGFNRNAEWRRYVGYYQQIDVGLLSHIAYNNLMGLHAYVGPDRQRINHMFVPSEAAAISDHHHSRPAPTLPQDVSNPFHVDLKTELGSMFAQLKSNGMQMSNLTVKAKSGATLTANQIKPIQLFHKIGYGSLEMIPLCPFEDDVDMKKFHDDWKKSKYCNESLTKTMPSSAAVLLVWKPFSSKAPIKRIIYVGSKCAVRKNFPSMITTLHSNLDFLKQADYTPHDGLVKKPTSARKTTPPVSATSKATSKSADNNTLVTAKKAVPPASDKSSRPITVSAPPVHTAKELPAKRPQTAGGKPKSDPAKQQEPTKKAPATLATNSKPAVVATNSTPKKHQQPSAINKKQPIDNKPQTKEPGHAKPTKSKADKPGITNGQMGHRNGQMPPHDVQHVLTTDMDTVPNGDDAVAVGDKPVAVDVPGAGAIDGDTCESIEPKPSTPDANSIVAVGTVECAITEHGEADFCDDTPEEITADQMKEMGYYDDEEEDKGRDKGCNPGGDGVNIAHLPMEGSFYGKDVLVEGGTDPAGSNHATVEGWSQPLAMPMPVKDAAVTTTGNATKKSAAGKQQQSPLSIYVDCLCVPCDLDKEDLRYLFETVKAATIYLQLEKPADLSKVLEMLLDEKEKDGASNGCHEPTKVIPSTADESYLMWAVDNNARMESCRVEVVADLSRCIISTFGTGGDHTDPGDCDSVAKGGFHGIKLEL